MIGRNTLFGMAVLAAAGVPYALNTVGDPFDRQSGSADEQPLAMLESQPHRHADPASTGPAFPALKSPPAQPLEGPQVADLSEVLRFDVSPRWVMERWPRVMSSRQEGDLQAYRVLLVTGAKESDLAGPLTYSFNAAQQLQQIHFQGATGDYRPLAQHLTSRYGLNGRRTTNPAEQVFEAKRDGRVVSQLRIVTAPLLDASMPTARYHVELLLARPSDHRWFSEAKQALPGIRWP